MKRLVTFILLLLLFFAVERFCHHATDGFAMVNIVPPKGDYSPYHRKGSLDPQISRQTFTYFDKGSQSYVFLSEDGQTVLKLFKFQHMRTPPILRFIPLKEKRKKKRAILEKTFQSLTLAYDKMREETALIMLHLAPTTHLKTELTIIDKIGRHHRIDLDKTPFLLQKRGERVYPTLTKLMEEGKTEKAKEALRSLLTLAASRCQKGIFDKDPDFSTNFGFIAEVPFQMDFGRLSVNPSEKDKGVYGPEMIRITREFEGWIQENHPSLLPTFKEALDEILSD